MTHFFSEQMCQHLAQLNQNKAKAEAVTAYKIALEVGLDPTYVTNIFKGRKRGSADTLRQLARSAQLGLSYETLRSWQALTEFEPEVLREAFKNTSFQHPDTVVNRKIPCLGLVTANGFRLQELTPDTAHYEWWGLERFSEEERKHLFCLRVQGDSMWPPVPDGSLILVRETADLRDGGWYVVLTKSGETTFKMVEFQRDKALLVPLNPAFSPELVTQASIAKFYEVLKYQVNRI